MAFQASTKLTSSHARAARFPDPLAKWQGVGDLTPLFLVAFAAGGLTSRLEVLGSVLRPFFGRGSFFHLSVISLLRVGSTQSPTNRPNDGVRRVHCLSSGALSGPRMLFANPPYSMLIDSSATFAASCILQRVLCHDHEVRGRRHRRAHPLQAR